jgi:hypothetical protein
MEKIHNKSKVWHSHGKHKGRVHIATILDRVHKKLNRASKMYGSVIEAVREENKRIGKR